MASTRMAARVANRFERATFAQRVAARFAKVFPSEEAMQKYLQLHPMAKPSNHSVKGKGDHGAHEPELKAQMAPSSETEEPAPEKAEPESKKPKAPKPESEAKAESEPKHKPESTPEDHTPAKVSATGVGKGSGRITLEGSSDQVRSKYESQVAATASTRTEGVSEDQDSQVGRMIEAVGAKEDAAKAREWASAWTSSASSGTLVRDFLADLDKPDSWARAQYEATQAIIRSKLDELKKRGVVDEDGNITLYRGVRGSQAAALRKQYPDLEKAHETSCGVRGLSCWTENPTAARRFTEKRLKSNEAIFEHKVHYTRVARMWQGQAKDKYSNELEWSVLSGEDGTINAKLHSQRTITQKYRKPKQ